ncbi:MAG TPA: DegT/DnrJ/EryC1/StrS family aminotransferase [Kofleriaceae bacterium]|nr:DegT/DnrJ/EryC1/StrS family aminotransferase [Kofleriaceae bacterium]
MKAFDMTSELAAIRPELDAAIARVLDSGTFIGGPEVEGFERELAAVGGARHAIGTSSGTDALHLLGMALDVASGDEIVTTPFTFFATAGSFARLGARLVFADIDDATLALDPAAALAACTSRTRAIVTVNLFGALAPLPATAIPIIEDSAQSLGAGPPRTLASAISCFPTKNLGALGDAGAILTNDDALADRVRLLRSHGARPKYHHLAIGGNFRLDALQAAVLRVKLAHLAAWTARRRAIAARYRALLADIPDVRLPVDDASCVYHQFVIRVPRRDALRAHLASRGIATEIYYPEPLHLQPCFAALGHRPGSLPNAERACREVLALPIYPTLSAAAQDHVASTIAEFQQSGQS